MVRARRQVGDDHERIARRARGGVVAEAQHAPRLGDPEVSVAHGQAVGEPQPRDDRNGRAKPIRARNFGEGDDTALIGDRYEQSPGGIKREHARGSEARGDDLGAEAGRKRDRQRLGGGRAERAELRGDEQRDGKHRGERRRETRLGERAHCFGSDVRYS